MYFVNMSLILPKRTSPGSNMQKHNFYYLEIVLGDSRHWRGSWFVYLIRSSIVIIWLSIWLNFALVILALSHCITNRQLVISFCFGINDTLCCADTCFCKIYQCFPYGHLLYSHVVWWLGDDTLQNNHTLPKSLQKNFT